jgi:subtilase family protein
MSRLLVPILLFATALYASDRVAVRPEEPQLTGFIVEFRPGATFEQFRRDVADIDRHAHAISPIRREYRLAMFGAAVESTDADALRRLPYVRAVYPDRVVTMCAIETDAAIDARTRVNAVSLPTRGEGIVVGVLDSGIDYLHPALGNGFGAGHKVKDGYDFVNDDADPMDDNGHGTHVAGIIAADSAELSGVAPGATLVAYKVLDGMGHGLESNVIAAIERSIDPNKDGDSADHLDVINLSFSGAGTADDPSSKAVDKATAAGIVVVVAAGNETVFGSVRSPGTARTAITVGAIDDAGVVTSFSSRGPSPASLAMKPDVMAPGSQIVSARRGGGLISMTGTSMAAPHVAGTAALLAKLHRDWKPADIKSALILTAGTLAGTPIARAAGRTDASRANSSTLFIDGTGVSFGLAPGKTSTATITRTMTMTNRGATAQTFDVVATNVPTGATIAATPPVLNLAPGASQSLELRLTIDNSAVAFPPDVVLGGDIEFRGAEKFSLPWIVARAARLTVTYDAPATSVVAISSDATSTPILYDLGKAEFFGKPDSKWDVILNATDTPSDATPIVRFVIAEDRSMAGDGNVALRKSNAMLELNLDARDRFGSHLGRLARDIEAGYDLTFAVDYQKGAQRQEVDYYFGRWAKILISPASASFTLYPFEAFSDLAGARVYNVQHTPLSGITESKTLTTNGSAYTHARLRFNAQGASNYSVSACITNALQQQGKLLDLTSIHCFDHRVTQPVAIDYYTTNDAGVGASGIMFVAGDVLLPALRGVDGEIVSAELDPTPVAYHIANDEEVTVGASPTFPLAFFGTTSGVRPESLRPGFTGPLGEWLSGATNATTWKLFSADSAVRASGTIDVVTLGPGPFAHPGDRFVATREGLIVSGHPARGELEVKFGSDESDLIPPTLTSLRIENGVGRITDRLLLGSNATLRFSAADLNYFAGSQTRPLVTEATRAFYRTTGTAVWHELTPIYVGTNDGSTTTLGHTPVGRIYRADLYAPAALLGTYDLRIEVEDAHANHVSWTQTAAFTVVAPKVRSARH